MQALQQGQPLPVRGFLQLCWVGSQMVGVALKALHRLSTAAAAVTEDIHVKSTAAAHTAAVCTTNTAVCTTDTVAAHLPPCLRRSRVQSKGDAMQAVTHRNVAVGF